MINQIASTLAQRTRASLLNRILDGSATKDDIVALRSMASDASRNTSGSTRADWLAANRLASSLTNSRYVNGQWTKVDSVDLRAAQTFAFGSGPKLVKYTY